MFSAIGINTVLAFKELMSNPLRTSLSLLGVAIGVFCIVSVRTVFNSLESNIQSNMATLGNDVLYIGKFPWMPENNQEYAWWKYKARPVSTLAELKYIQKNAPSVGYSTILYSDEGNTISFKDTKIENANVYAVSYDFNKLQPIELEDGRYFSLREMDHASSNTVVLGYELANELFGNIPAIDKEVRLFGKKFMVIGVLKKQGQSITGFQFDQGVIMSYNYYSSLFHLDGNSGNGFADPMLLLKTREGSQIEDMKSEVEGLLRAERKLKPKDENNFSFNQLEGIQSKVSQIFGQVQSVGFLIGLFSLVVGIFSVANIMFVSVRERTNLIGIKKAIGARNSTVLSEFLIESVILCLFGGIVGLLFVFGLTQFIRWKFEFPINMSLGVVLFGVILSILVGVISGFIPAYQASKLDPVTAIRS